MQIVVVFFQGKITIFINQNCVKMELPAVL